MKLLLTGIILLSILSVQAFAAIDYYNWDEQNKTATIYKNSQKWFSIQGEILSSNIVEMREKIIVTSNYNYDFSVLDDFGEDYEVHKGKSRSSELSTTWYSQVLENYMIVIDDTEPSWQNTSEERYNNQTGLNETIWNNYTIQVVVGNHTENRTRINQSLFTPTNKKIQAGQILTFIKVTKKMPEIGEFSILLKPKFMGASIKELTWWNGSATWKYPIKVNNTGNANTLTHFEVPANITINASIMAGNGSDFLIINDTDGTVQPLWIDNSSSINGSYINLWMNLSSIPASVWTNNTYYLYIVPGAFTSNGTNTFKFFDDFEDGNYNGWTAGSTATLSMPTDSTRYLKSTIPDTDGKFHTAAYATAMASSLSTVYEGRVNHIQRYPGITFRHSTDNTYYIIYYLELTDGIVIPVYMNGGTRTDLSPGANLVGGSLNTWENFKLTINDTGNITYLYRGVTNTWTNNVLPAGKIGFANYGNSGQGQQIALDDVRVRKYASPEPTAQLGAVEIASSPSIISNSTYRTFTATWNQTVNVSWYWNSTSIQTNNSVTTASYTNSSLINGTHNITATGTNPSGNSSSITWLWTISPAQAGEAIREFIQVIMI
jgi:hypothetical protein